MFFISSKIKIKIPKIRDKKAGKSIKKMTTKNSLKSSLAVQETNRRAIMTEAGTASKLHCEGF